MITGGVIIVLSILAIIYLGFLGSQGVDYVSIVTGFFFLIVGFLILFNKKEDEIEKIKKGRD
jgi:hypothetical protein